MIKAVHMVDIKRRHPFGNWDNLCSFQIIVHRIDSAALSLKVSQKVTNRDKQQCIKFHYFWSYKNNKNNKIQCITWNTEDQKVNDLTKSLIKQTFGNFHILNQGW